MSCEVITITTAFIVTLLSVSRISVLLPWPTVLPVAVQLDCPGPRVPSFIDKYTIRDLDYDLVFIHLSNWAAGSLNLNSACDY